MPFNNLEFEEIAHEKQCNVTQPLMILETEQDKHSIHRFKSRAQIKCSKCIRYWFRKDSAIFKAFFNIGLAQHVKKQLFSFCRKLNKRFY